MTIKKTVYGLCLIGLGWVSQSPALEIPLSGGTAQGGGAVNIGYVDMEKIFQLYPQTQIAKEDYVKKLKKMREDLAAKETAVQNLKERIAVLESTLRSSGAAKDAAIQSSSDTAAAPSEPGSIASMKKDLETLLVENEEARKHAADELIAFEKRQSQVILGKIYAGLKELAEDEQVTLVVDKTSILFGSASIDLTDKLLSRVRGY